MSTTFADLGVPDQIVAVLASHGIVQPFSIQAATIPDAMAGRDICGRAPTGSGKTLAFGIPLVAGLRGADKGSPEALVLVPTRELCAQVADQLAELTSGSSSRVVSVYGGVSDRPQRKALARGAAVVVACPGRLEDLLSQGALRLDFVRHVVIDEADRMADMGFLPAVQRILDATSADRQTQLFSATLGGPVATLIRDYQKDAIHYEIKEEAHPLDVDHQFHEVARSDRVVATARAIGGSGPTVVFCRTRHGATRLTKQLLGQGVTSAVLHGGRTQVQRDRALRDFSAGRIQALVATDVAARGIHVDGVACVVHFDLAPDPDTYVHRSGRTGRAGASGTVVSLVDPQDAKAAAQLKAAIGQSKNKTASAKRHEDRAAGGEATSGRKARYAEQPSEAGAKSPSRDKRTPKATHDVKKHDVKKHDVKKHEATKRDAKRQDAKRQDAKRHEPQQHEANLHQAKPHGTMQRKSPAVETGRGQVKFYDKRKGYGFILTRAGDDLFVHHTNIVGDGFRSLQEGQKVQFTIGKGRKGAEARAVRTL